MAEKKRQHYVPKMLLKNFANSSKNIYCYDRDKNTFRSNIPYANQCKKDYFYGNSRDIEDFLCAFERIVDNILTKLSQFTNTNEFLTIDEYRVLSMFMVAQYLRTKGMLERTSHSLDDFRSNVLNIVRQYHSVYEHKETDEEAIQRLVPKYNSKEMVRNNIRIAIETFKDYSDLAVLIIENHTDVNFISSVDPMVMKNIYYPKRGIGLALRGIIGFLPITPKRALLLVDEIAYFKPRTITPYIIIDNEIDVLKMNTWQFGNSKLLFSFDDKSLKITVDRCLSYKKNNYMLAKNYTMSFIAYENPFLSDETVRKKTEESLANEDEFNNAINEYVDDDNIPSFLHIYEEMKREGKRRYWNIPARRNFTKT